MAEERYQITIYPAVLNGKKSTQKGISYWQIQDRAKVKYRFYDEGLYNRINVGKSYDVEVWDFTGTFKNERGKEVEYTIKTIHNILSAPLDENEPLDKVLMDSEISPQRKMSTNVSEQVEDKPDWDAIARGKVRNSVASAAIQNSGLISLTGELIEVMEEYVDYIMSGPDHED